jgi:hypothetical protein
VGSTDGAIYVEAKGTDLYAIVNDPSFSGDVLAGSIGRTTVAIDNYGNAAADGTVTITLFLDDGHDGMTPLTTVAQQVNLAPDQELAVPMAFVLPAGLKAGEYQLVAEVNPPDSFNDACDDNIGTSDWFDVTGPGSDLSVSVGQITVTGAGQDSGSQPGGTSLENSNGGSFDGAGLPAGGAGAVSITSGGVMLLGGGPTVSNCLAYNLGDSCISPSIYRVSFPRTMAPPSGSVSLTVGNQGGGVQGNVIVSLYASTDGSFDGATPIADQSVYVSLGDGEQQSLNVNFFMPGTLADGDYYLLAKVSAPAVFGDTNADNNAAASGSTFAFTQPPADSSGSTYYWPNYSYLLSAYSNGYSCYALCDLVATSTVSGGGQGNVKSLVGGSSQHSASSQHGGDSQPRHYTGGGSTSAIDSLPTPASQAPVSDLLAVAADAPSVLATAPRLVNLDANLAIVGPVGQAPAQGAAMPAGGTFGYYEKPSAGQSPWGSSTHLKKLLSPILTGDGLDDATLSTPLIQVV